MKPLFCLIGLALGFCVSSDVPSVQSPTYPFENVTNGFEDQVSFDVDRAQFEEVETILPAGEIHGGLGPSYNATSCVACHQNPVTGSSSQVAELRAGHFGPDSTQPERLAFVPHPGGSLVHQRSISPRLQEKVFASDTSRTLRLSTNILGDGFVECIPDEHLIRNIARQVSAQFGDMRGVVVLAPVAVTVTTSREHVGRFGWKSQHASLLNFSADAYINEMGITSPLQPTENQPNGEPIPPGIDQVPDPEDPPSTDHIFGEDVEAFARFMRSTKPPPRDAAIQPAIAAGEKLFLDRAENHKMTGCAICHTPHFTTLPPGSPIDGNFSSGVVPAALGSKTISPFSDFLLHDIGTGDGIVQTGHAQFPPRSSDHVESLAIQSLNLPVGAVAKMVHLANDELNQSGDLIDTARMLRTAPLWGLRVRNHLLHDGSALTIDDAIRRHSGQAERVKLNYAGVLTQEERDQLLAFLGSL